MSEHQNTPAVHSTGRNDEANVMMPVLVLIGVITLMLLVLLSGRTVVEVPEVAVADTETVDEVVEHDMTAPEMSDTVMGMYSSQDIATGQSLYVASCSGCHGSNAEGIQGLGKNLVVSDFIEGMTDTELHEFIVVGRTAWDPLNTTGIAMPPRGGNPALNDDGIDQIIAYIRTLANPELIEVALAGNRPTTATTTAETSVDEPSTQAPTTDDTRAEVSAPVFIVPETVHEFSAAEEYAISCAGCHGIEGEGIGEWAGIGDSDLLSDNDALLTFIMPRGFVEPVDGFAHPTLLEFPPRTEAQYQEVVDYIMGLGQ